MRAPQHKSPMNDDVEKQKSGKELATVPVSTRRPEISLKERSRWLEYIILSLGVAALVWQVRSAFLDMVWKILSIVVAAIWGISATPEGFPASGNGLWYTEPGEIWSRDYLPIGNGYLAAMTPGGATQEILQLNIESLWSGGPFADPVRMQSVVD